MFMPMTPSFESGWCPTFLLTWKHQLGNGGSSWGHISIICINSKDYLKGPDLQLSEADFKSVVTQLTSSLDYLDWIWRGAESKTLKFSF